jgi:hypothetical protein
MDNCSAVGMAEEYTHSIWRTDKTHVNSSVSTPGSWMRVSRKLLLQRISTPAAINYCRKCTRKLCSVNTTKIEGGGNRGKGKERQRERERNEERRQKK